MPAFEGNFIKEYSLGSDKLSISEPNLSADRFAIRHLHEYLTIDDLKYYRRRKPFDFIAKSHFNLYQPDGTTNPGFINSSPAISEYKSHYLEYNNLDSHRRLSLRRATSLKLEGIMPLNKSESQDCFLWYTPEECKRCRIYPIKRAENFRLSGDMYLEPEYRSSYISHTNLNPSVKILPREMFHINSEHKSNSSEIKPQIKNENANDTTYLKTITSAAKYQAIENTEYNLQFVPFCIEKAKSIPQITHIEMQGKFQGVPEYRDRYRMYTNYAKPQPIKKMDNLRISGSEVYENHLSKNTQLFKTDDPLKPTNRFRNRPTETSQYSQSDLQLNDKKIEYKPEYRAEYLNFPRSRPAVTKPKSTFSLPNSSTTAIAQTKEINDSTTSTTEIFNLSELNNNKEIMKSPEYRKACYSYQIRKRSPLPPTTTTAAAASVATNGRTEMHLEERKSFVLPKKLHHQRRTACQQQSSELPSDKTTFTSILPTMPKFGRRATALRNADNCRQKTSIIEGNPHYRIAHHPTDNTHNSFVILADKHNSYQRLSL